MGRIILNLKSNSNIPEPHTEIVSVICIKQKVSLCLVLIKCGGLHKGAKLTVILSHLLADFDARSQELCDISSVLFLSIVGASFGSTYRFAYICTYTQT